MSGTVGGGVQWVPIRPYVKGRIVSPCITKGAIILLFVGNAAEHDHLAVEAVIDQR